MPHLRRHYRLGTHPAGQLSASCGMQPGRRAFVCCGSCRSALVVTGGRSGTLADCAARTSTVAPAGNNLVRIDDTRLVAALVFQLSLGAESTAHFEKRFRSSER